MQTAFVSLITFTCGFLGIKFYRNRDWVALAITIMIGGIVYGAHIYLVVTS